MTTHFVPAKTKAFPESRHRALLRPRLLKLLDELRGARAALIIGPPGAGKSTLAASFFASRGIVPAWCKLDRDDADRIVFLRRLIETLQQRLPECDLGLPSQLLSTGRNAAVEDRIVLRELLDRLSNLPEQVWIVFDDYDVVSHCSSLNHNLDYLFAHAPSDLHLLLISCVDPALPQLVRSQIYGEAVTVNGDSLAFTIDEARLLLCETHDLELADSDLEELIHRTGGWAAALPLVYRQLADRGVEHASAVIRGTIGSDTEIYKYFAYCVMERQPPQMREFLEAAAVLSELTTDACAAVADHPEEVGALLQRVRQNHLFVSSLGHSNDRLAFHPLFREFLLARLVRRIGEAKVRLLHLRAAEFFRQGEMWTTAIHHYLQASAWPEAVGLIGYIAPEWILQGHLETIQRFIEQLPIAVRDHNPVLLLFLGKILRLRDMRAQARANLEASLSLFRSRSDHANEASVLIELGYLDGYHQPAESIRRFESALATGRNVALEPSLYADAYCGLSASYATSGSYSAAHTAAQQALTSAERIGDARGLLHARNYAKQNLAWLLIQQGHISEAIRTAAELCEITGSGEFGQRMYARSLFLLGLALRGEGDFPKSVALLCRAWEMAVHHDTAHVTRLVAVSCGAALAMSEQFAAAEEWCQRAGHPDDTVEFGYLRLLQGELAEARAVLSCALRAAELADRPPEVARISAAIGVAYLEEGNLTEAGKHLDRAIGLYQAMGAQGRIPGLLLHQSRLYLSLGRADEARARLRSTLARGEADNRLDFIAWFPPTLACLAPEALRSNISPGFMVRLCGNALTMRSLGPILPLLDDRSGSLRSHAAEIVRAVEKRAPAGQIFSSDLVAALATCTDPAIERRIKALLQKGVLTQQGLLLLRKRFNLTWREIHVFVEYYLFASGVQGEECMPPERRQVAAALNLSEHTLRGYVSSVRQKLALSGHKGESSVLQWALRNGIVATSPLSH